MISFCFCFTATFAHPVDVSIEVDTYFVGHFVVGMSVGVDLVWIWVQVLWQMRVCVKM